MILLLVVESLFFPSLALCSPLLESVSEIFYVFLFTALPLKTGKTKMNTNFHLVELFFCDSLIFRLTCVQRAVSRNVRKERESAFWAGRLFFFSLHYTSVKFNFNGNKIQLKAKNRLRHGLLLVHNKQKSLRFAIDENRSEKSHFMLERRRQGHFLFYSAISVDTFGRKSLSIRTHCLRRAKGNAKSL